MSHSAFELVNPESNAIVFKVESFDNNNGLKKFNRYNYFSVILILEGKGKVLADTSEYLYDKNSLLCFSLYQPFKIECDQIFKATMINFHPDFFCLHKHRNEVSCNGVLFNNVYDAPVISLTGEESGSMETIFNGMQSEMARPGKPLPEVLLSYLKILLINASRLKIEKLNAQNLPVASKDPDILNQLKDAIEENFRSMHRPGDYANLLNITAPALNRISKTHFNKTLTNLIAERLITEGKRQLYLTSKSVKLIAYELGFNDEFYFSRYFKSNVGISPQFFRDTVGFDKANE
ncbi:AraC-like DNA-binding protein [Mucilaginibacter frigoritolerans]|uniref:AraC-like DNA-binding protein n=1 Tax=Mucilaginibacter frigoritolerans TaxID=652788 RepID=A0A562U975_9SPHI|nr:helix-turn-helix domain-containing protein [Mucilaginibacter frigoritolerans]TWJ02383.1 AraC-like DNA-binding protein [Mucilaginibacter frigoritolerans]